ncbi:MAG: ATP-dependent DNA helicase RecG [Berkelbacteria bacterium GW2011_GWA2_38_9]|uniref:Probable DNA 3'-5' helicase RecG n=1 Tax=Berkelbacteria bacterium GW2011_GWA2_38_9 TaxID=1618334 RepID=A0A0G0LDM8_9BACT|nr:MAG: ATP-dependent DNA helicase RecG [Berkelbacteria bacterium GW2011_GWA2_38_9]
MNLTDPIQYLKGVGPKMAENFTRLGVGQVGDLLTHYPRRYLDLSSPQKVSDALPDEINVFRAKIIDLKSSRALRKNMNILKATLQDESGEINAIWFNQPFLSNVLQKGATWIFYGKVERNFQRERILMSPQFEHRPQMISIYPETEGISSKYIRLVVSQVLQEIRIVENLPENIIKSEQLLARSEAILKIHQPQNWADVNLARNRLAFEEMLTLALRLTQSRLSTQKELAQAMPVQEKLLKSFAAKLPFELTVSQKKAIWQIILDLSKPVPMSRLLNGDVGSGKTIVAAMVAYHVVKSGYQVAVMAPTEILANQHYQTFSKFLQPFKISVGLQTANNGVKQREILRQKSKLSTTPHFLSMTATPIPRTLALSLYGDLDISVLDELPKGRQKITTTVVHPSKRSETYHFIEEQIKAGRQAFVICPLIEKSGKVETQRILSLQDIDKKTVLEEFEKLDKNIFPHRKIGLLHGRLKSAEKEEVMKQFKEGKLDIIVSTSVVEVGVDVSNATVMMIEGAENFGLAQLWQFRGRVGRGQHASYCFLFTEIWSEKIRERLFSISTAKNGFELAEKDLTIRGPGEVVGISQSGIPDFKMASLTDLALINRSRQAAEQILAKDPNLQSLPDLKLAVEKMATRHLE